ncbi:MAG: ferrous iron transport protein A [Chloroflexi bacterium]|nr:ferrous iron transport protein A [Chloroflexota bacterium]
MTTISNAISATPFSAPTPTQTLPLSMANVGEKLQLVDIRTCRTLTHRLAELGLTHGVTLKIVQNSGGPLLISVRGSRIAIGRGMAHKLQVVPTT